MQLLKIEQKEAGLIGLLKRKKSYELASLAAKNEMTEIYDKHKRKASKKRLPLRHLTSIICNVKKRNSFPDDVLITESCVQQRIKTKTLHVVASNPEPLSPLHVYRMEFSQVIIQMARMRESLSPSESVHLINSMIAGTQAQTDTNFSQMYEHIYDEMIDVGVVVKLESPIWKDRYGKIRTEDNSFNGKVTHDLT